MSVQILYFASLKETLGRAGETIALPATVRDLAGLTAYLAERAPALLATANLRAAVNQEMASPETPVQDGDEVAFFPPVTGG